MFSFIARRIGTILLTMLCLTLVVFFLVNLEPNLKKLAISQTEMHTSAEQLESWLVNHGYRQNFFARYGQWLGVLPKPAWIGREDLAKAFAKDTKGKLSVDAACPIYGSSAWRSWSFC